jgi:hypothetical protein
MDSNSLDFEEYQACMIGFSFLVDAALAIPNLPKDE